MTDAPLIAALHARAKEAEAAAYDAQTDRETEAHTAVLAAVELLIASIDALAFVEGPYVPSRFVKSVRRVPGTVRVVEIVGGRTRMKINIMGMLKSAALDLRRVDGFTAYGLLELANNLRLVMRGEETMEAFCKVYVGQDKEPIDIDNLLPKATP